MQTTQTILLPVAMHPDLFGGETPVLAPVKTRARLYEVEVRAQRTETIARRLRVLADSPDAAARIAEEIVDSEEDDLRAIEAEWVEPLPAEPTPAEVADYIRRIGDGR